MPLIILALAAYAAYRYAETLPAPPAVHGWPDPPFETSYEAFSLEPAEPEPAAVGGPIDDGLLSAQELARRARVSLDGLRILTERGLLNVASTAVDGSLRYHQQAVADVLAIRDRLQRSDFAKRVAARLADHP
jgi:hypothetical protein